MNVKTIGDHKTEKVILENGTEFDCDVEIAPAIRKLNANGFSTKYCCSGHPEEDAYASMYIYFKSIEDDNEESRLYELIRKLREYFILEQWYDIISSNGRRILTRACNPDTVQLNHITRACFGLTFGSVFNVNDDGTIRIKEGFKRHVIRELVIRPNIPDECFCSEYVEGNHKFITDGIEALMTMLEEF